jgi:hypothetical protein
MTAVTGLSIARRAAAELRLLHIPSVLFSITTLDPSPPKPFTNS